MPPLLLAILTACLATAFEGVGLLGGFGAGGGGTKRLMARDGGDDPDFGILHSYREFLRAAFWSCAWRCCAKLIFSNPGIALVSGAARCAAAA
jgi:hypothetical protein